MKRNIYVYIYHDVPWKMIYVSHLSFLDTIAFFCTMESHIAKSSTSVVVNPISFFDILRYFIFSTETNFTRIPESFYVKKWQILVVTFNNTYTASSKQTKKPLFALKCFFAFREMPINYKLFLYNRLRWPFKTAFADCIILHIIWGQSIIFWKCHGYIMK